ncbi:MAG: efflux RND transporter periplasmic adaptor subunit [Ignavibacteriales bacterium]|nr:efflux RND transporter periplasmic adaptor subunit [Ignavibacteriales bacterium]
METKNADLSSLRIDRSSNNSNQNKKLFNLILILIITLLIIAGIYFLWEKLFNKGVSVNLTTATLVSQSQTSAILTASGYVVAQRKAAIASKATGRLVYLGVVEGDPVVKGQIIGRLEDDDVKSQLDQAKATLKLYEADLISAEDNYKREKELFASKTNSEKEFSAAESTYKRTLASIELAKAQIKAAEIAVEYTLIRAPFNGTVLTKNADVGEIVSPLGASSTSRAAVVTIADMTSLQVEADVSESNIERIEMKQDCEITLDAYPSNRYAGYVDKIVPTADRSKATVLVKVAFKNYDKRVLPEMSAKVLFLSEAVNEETMNEKPLLVIPKTAVVNRNSKLVVYKILDDKAQEFEVTIGKEVGSNVEVTSGLNNGESVISNVTDEIKNNTKVYVEE